MTLKDLSTADRPREKLLNFGASHLTTSELLALALNTSGSRDTSVLDLAHELLGNTASLRLLASKSIAELTKTKGIGPAKAALIHALFEIAHRYEAEEHPLTRSLRSPAEIAAHFASRFRDATEEVFTLLCFDSRQRLILEKEISTGCAGMVVTQPRKIFHTAIEHRATGIILIHNHPSGDPTPSDFDKELTQRVHDGGLAVGVPLLDHIILGEKSYFSFHEAEML